MPEVTKKWSPRISNGHPFGHQIKKKRKKVVPRSTLKELHTMCCTRGLSGRPPTLKIMHLCKRNHHFHNSTRSPHGSTLFWWGPLWDPFGAQNGENVSQSAHQRTLNKNNENFNDFRRSNRPQNDFQKWVSRSTLLVVFVVQGPLSSHVAPDRRLQKDKKLPWRKNRSTKSYHIVSYMQAGFRQCVQIERGAAMTRRRRFEYIYIYIYIYIYSCIYCIYIYIFIYACHIFVKSGVKRPRRGHVSVAHRSWTYALQHQQSTRKHVKLMSQPHLKFCDW